MSDCSRAACWITVNRTTVVKLRFLYSFLAYPPFVLPPSHTGVKIKKGMIAHPFGKLDISSG